MSDPSSTDPTEIYKGIFAQECDLDMKKRMPGLRGTYDDTCVVCIQPTDSVLASRGEAEWHIAFLINLGVPQDEATAMVETGPGHVPAGVYEVIYQVCRDCVERSGHNLPKPVVERYGVSVPTVSQLDV